MAIRERVLKADDWQIPDVRSQLSEVILRHGRPGEAEPLLRSAVDDLARTEFVSMFALKAARARLALLGETRNAPTTSKDP